MRNELHAEAKAFAPDPIRDRILELTHDPDPVKATIAILLKQAYDAGKNGTLDGLPELMTVLERGSIPDSWTHDNTDQPAPLHRHAASTRQTIAELIEAKADASAIALLANHLETVELLIQQQDNVGFMRVETAEENDLRDQYFKDFLKRKESRDRAQ